MHKNKILRFDIENTLTMNNRYFEMTLAWKLGISH